MTEVQNAILSIYKEIRKICMNYNIPFFAIGGTCIGALRHNGFIPWDDDLDIAIPIEEFDRFVEVAKESFPPNLEILSGANVEHNKNVFIKVVDIQSTFIQKHEIPYPDAYKGIFVDIMPISGVPVNYIKKSIFCFQCNSLYWMNEFRRFPSNDSHGLKKIIRKVAYSIIKNMPYDFFYNKYIELLKKHPFNTSVLTGYVWSLRVKSLIFPTKYFLQKKDISFEDTLMPCPLEAEKYLSMQFGNYMKLPPASEQRTSHEGIIIFDKSYKDFQHDKSLLEKYICKE